MAPRGVCFGVGMFVWLGGGFLGWFGGLEGLRVWLGDGGYRRAFKTALDSRG